jgi:TetR/AcrR family transcriptional regulator, lmrAB and yxaGH operons repressor
MARTTDARERAIMTAERLFRTQGFAATGLTQILSESGAPKGSFYFHFPDGKTELAREVLARYGARATALIRALSAKNPGNAPAFVDQLCDAFASEMKSSGFTLGCAVQNLAAEAFAGSEDLKGPVRDILDQWSAAISIQFRESGFGAARSDRMARILLNGLFGARTDSRITASVDAFKDLAWMFRKLL